MSTLIEETTMEAFEATSETVKRDETAEMQYGSPAAELFDRFPSDDLALRNDAVTGPSYSIHGSGVPANTANGFDEVEQMNSRYQAPSVPEPSEVRYQLLQKWEGYVTAVGEETFWAELLPLFGEPGEHVAEINLAEIDPIERELLEPGAVFYWSIYFKDTTSGRLRESFIRFQRLPRLTARQVERARTRGKEILGILGGE